MKSNIAKRWIKALRSGLYKQGTEQLKNANNEYCCLGVLCDLHSKSTGKKWHSNLYLGSFATAPITVAKWAGMKEQNADGYIKSGASLTELNDNRQYSFKQIARAIERNIKHL